MKLKINVIYKLPMVRLVHAFSWILNKKKIILGHLYTFSNKNTERVVLTAIVGKMGRMHKLEPNFVRHPVHSHLEKYIVSNINCIR